MRPNTLDAAKLSSLVASVSIAVLFMLASPSLVRAQSDPDSARSVMPATGRAKSAMVATLLEVIPGVGHAYAGEGKRGLKVVGVLLGIAAATGIVSIASCVSEVVASSSTDSICESNAAENVGALAFYGVWGWSIYDAGQAARRTNARLPSPALKSITVGMTRLPTATGHDVRAMKVGLRFTTR